MYTDTSTCDNSKGIDVEIRRLPFAARLRSLPALPTRRWTRTAVAMNMHSMRSSRLPASRILRPRTLRLHMYFRVRHLCAMLAPPHPRLVAMTDRRHYLTQILRWLACRTPATTRQSSYQIWISNLRLRKNLVQLFVFCLICVTCSNTMI